MAGEAGHRNLGADNLVKLGEFDGKKKWKINVKKPLSLQLMWPSFVCSHFTKIHLHKYIEPTK